MNSSVLHPPHSYVLSDAVIGEVSMRRTHATKYLSDGDFSAHGRQISAYQQSNPKPINPHTTYQSRFNSVTLSTSIPFENSTLNDLSPAERSLELHRLRRRRTQQRYRKKLQNKSLSLEDEVVGLKTEIQLLEKKRLQTCIPSNVATNTVPWKVVVEYFRLFRHGYYPVAPVAELCKPTSALCQDPGFVQTQFVKAVADPNVLFNAGYGVEAALEDWRMVSLHHENFSYNLESVQRGAGGCVMAYMNGITTITKKMLLMAFPDIQKGDNGAKLASLAAKLLGQQLVVPGELCFHFDDTNSRIVSARYEADMLTPLLKLLQDVEEASIVLNSALGIHHWSS